MSAEVAKLIHGKLESVNSLNVQNHVRLDYFDAFFTSLNCLLCFSMAALFSLQMFIRKLSSSPSSPSPALVSELAGYVLPCSSFQA